MRSLTPLLVMLVCCVIGACSDATPDFNVAYNASQKGDYATALPLYRRLAEQGNAAAQNNLGAMYVKGQGVPQDYASAVFWFRKAAEQGNALAQNSSASCTPEA